MHLPNLSTNPNRDAGPQVLVTDGEHSDHGQPAGVWLDLHRPFDELADTLRAGGIVPARMVIVDQFGCGPVMIDEDIPLLVLHDHMNAGRS